MFGTLRNFLKYAIVSLFDDDDHLSLMFPVPESAILKIKCLYDDAQIPVRGSNLAAGYDLRAHSYVNMESKETVSFDDENVLIIPVGSRCLIKTGIAVAIPQNCYGRVAPRSGLTFKNGINIGAGVIDADYRGEVGVIIFNNGSEDFTVQKGDRIAQLICERIIHPTIKIVDDLDSTERGGDGFGSTGTS